jgi:hypothetical protein
MKTLEVTADPNMTEIATTVKVVFPTLISRHTLCKIERALEESKILTEAKQIKHEFPPADKMKNTLTVYVVKNTTPIIVSATFRVRTRGTITFLGRDTVAKIVRRYVR